jgi:hypothetical protein
MSRSRSNRNFNSGGIIRGVPRAGQHPDPSDFGRRGQGERHQRDPDEVPPIYAEIARRREAARAEREAERAARQIVTVDIETVTGRWQSREPNPAQLLRTFEIVVDWGIETVDLPTKHTGHGWSIHVDAESVGGVRFARVEANLKELDITAEELGDALRDAMRKLNQEKKPALSALNPNRKRALCTRVQPDQSVEYAKKRSW